MEVVGQDLQVGLQSGQYHSLREGRTGSSFRKVHFGDPFGSRHLSSGARVELFHADRGGLGNHGGRENGR